VYSILEQTASRVARRTWAKNLTWSRHA